MGLDYLFLGSSYVVLAARTTIMEWRTIFSRMGIYIPTFLLLHAMDRRFAKDELTPCAMIDLRETFSSISCWLYVSLQFISPDIKCRNIPNTSGRGVMNPLTTENSKYWKYIEAVRYERQLQFNMNHFLLNIFIFSDGRDGCFSMTLHLTTDFKTNIHCCY